MKIDKEALRTAIPLDQYYAGELGTPGRNGKYTCPWHEDKNPSLVADDKGVKCFVCNEKNMDVFEFHMKMHSLTFAEAIKELASRYMPQSNGAGSKKAKKDEGPYPADWADITASYDYFNDKGEFVYQICRRSKDTRAYPRHKRADGSWWTGINNQPKYLYNLPILLAASADTVVYIPEGEKDCDTLTSRGLLAVCNPFGAQKWLPDEHSQHLKDRKSIILEDNDDPGRKHGKLVAESIHGIAKGIKIVRFQDLPEKSDITDFIELHGLEAYKKRQAEAKLYEGSYQEYFNDPIPEPEPAKENPDGDTDSADSENRTQADRLVEMAADWEKLHDPDSEAYVTIPAGITYRVNSSYVRKFLRNGYYRMTQRGAKSAALDEAISTIESQCQFDGPKREVFHRTGRLGDKIYLDLCAESGRVVEIDKDGWRLLDKSPVKFSRVRYMREIKAPVAGGSLEPLKRLYVLSESDWKLALSIMVYFLNPKGPYPILCLEGGHGSGKSTFSRAIKALLDPTKAPIKARPHDERDLAIAAQNSWVLAYDNLSGLKPSLSDSFCRLSTGGGLSTRSLYTDAEETVFDYCRPLVLNGIDTIAKQPDLADRAIRLRFSAIPDDKRISEEEFWSKFNEMAPAILGILLDGVSSALKNLPDLKMEKPPRMVDFAKWGAACESGFNWEPGSFLEAYRDNRAELVDTNIEENAFISALLDMLENEPDNCWTGTATELLEKMKEFVDEFTSNSKYWPKPNRVKTHLNRHEPSLKMKGYLVTYCDRKKKSRDITIEPITDTDSDNGQDDVPF